MNGDRLLRLAAGFLLGLGVGFLALLIIHSSAGDDRTEYRTYPVCSPPSGATYCVTWVSYVGDDGYPVTRPLWELPLDGDRKYVYR